MTDRKPTTLLLRAKSRFEAQVVLALLRGEGIVAYVNGEALSDEFAASQRLMGLQGTEIQVRVEDLARARDVLEEARREGRQLTDGGPEDETGPDIGTDGPVDEP